MINEEVTSTLHEEIQEFNALGKGLYISPKAFVNVNKPGFKAEFFVETVTVCVGIGKDDVAHVIMTKKAWEALKAGEKVNATTLKDFIGKVKPKRKKSW